MLGLPYRMHDSSIPPSKLLPGFRAVAGYLGGDTPHVWRVTEWDRFKGVPKLPIWVNNRPGRYADGRNDAFLALNALFVLRVPRGSTVAYDLETDISPDKVRGFVDVMTWAGFYVWVYGSVSTVFKNNAADYWPAHYTDTPAWPTRNSRAFQFQANVPVPGEPNIDVSWVRWWQIRTRKLWI